jgi:hypothetical protein
LEAPGERKAALFEAISNNIDLVPSVDPGRHGAAQSRFDLAAPAPPIGEHRQAGPIGTLRHPLVAVILREVIGALIDRQQGLAGRSFGEDHVTRVELSGVSIVCWTAATIIFRHLRVRSGQAGLRVRERCGYVRMCADRGRPCWCNGKGGSSRLRYARSWGLIFTSSSGPAPGSVTARSGSVPSSFQPSATRSISFPTPSHVIV